MKKVGQRLGLVAGTWASVLLLMVFAAVIETGAFDLVSYAEISVSSNIYPIIVSMALGIFDGIDTMSDIDERRFIIVLMRAILFFISITIFIAFGGLLYSQFAFLGWHDIDSMILLLSEYIFAQLFVIGYLQFERLVRASR